MVSIIESSVGLGIAIGPALAVILYAIGGLQALFFTWGMSLILSASLVWFIFKSEIDRASPSREPLDRDDDEIPFILNPAVS